VSLGSPQRSPRHTYKVNSRKVVFKKGPIQLVDCKVSLSTGQVLSRQILEHPGCVVIIPKIAKDRFLLARQFRLAAKGWIWEWPAGGIEKGEAKRAAAQRELMEEVGFRSKRLSKLLEFMPTPGTSEETMYVYLAEDLVPKSLEGDEDEDIEVGKFSEREIEKMIQTGKILDGKTILGFRVYQHARKK